jgi:ATP-dependent DNA helicase HFM1/MER3
LLQLPLGSIRFIAVSATLNNIQDVARWLTVPKQGLKVFGEETRPVKLSTIVKGYESTRTDFLFERRLNEFLIPIILQYSKGKPSLIFCRYIML